MDFRYVKVGDDEKRMIMCREKDFDPNTIRGIAAKAFPELFNGLGGCLAVTIGLGGPKIKPETCWKMYSSEFDCQVGPLQKGNDWEAHPFVALKVFEKGGKTFCGAEAVH